MYVVVSLNPDGTAAVTTPIVTEGETARQAAERVATGIDGGEVLSAAAATVLRRGDTPPNPVPVMEFRNRIVAAYFVLPTKDAATQGKWKQIIADFLPPDRAPVDLDSPAVKFLVQQAAAAACCTAEQAAAARAKT